MRDLGIDLGEERPGGGNDGPKALRWEWVSVEHAGMRGEDRQGGLRGGPGCRAWLAGGPCLDSEWNRSHIKP